MIINTSEYLGNQSVVEIELTAGTRSSGSLSLLVVTPNQFALSAKTRSRATLQISQFPITEFNLSAKSVSKAALELSQFGITQFNFRAKTISQAAIALDNKGNLEFKARQKNSARMNLRIVRQTQEKLIVTFRIVPKTRANGRHKDRAKFYVNNVEFPISAYSADFPERSAGCILNVTLARFSDKSVITPDAVYKFELSKKIAGEWITRTIINTGELQGLNLTLGFADKKRTDSFSMSTFEPLANRLGKSPMADTVIFDPFRVSASEISSKIIRDTEGVAYSTVKYPVPNLSMYRLFTEIFKNRCGFSNWKTNIPESSLKRVDLSVGASYMDAIAPYCGVFEPDFTPVGETLWIRDTTALLPAGFPAPTPLTVDDYDSIGFSNNLSEIDCYDVVFNEDKDDWDFFEPHVETLPVNKSGSPFDEDYSETKITRTSLRYYRYSEPGVMVKEDLFEEVRETRDTFNTTGRVTEKFQYDSFGRQIKSTKTTETNVPHDDGSSSVFLEVESDEKVEIVYGAHPFDASKQVQLLVTRIRNGKISVDTENQYRGEDFEQPLLLADKFGNAENGDIRYGPIEKTTESLQILPNEQVRSIIIVEDLIKKRLDFDFSEVKYGDISSRQNGRTREVRVFENPGDTFTGKGKDTLAGGELPPSVLIPLARRKIKKRRGAGGELEMSMTGLELFMDRGVAYTVLEREEGLLGVFSVRGLRFTGQNIGTRRAAHSTTFRGSKI